MNNIRSFVLLFSLFVGGCAAMKVSDFSTLEYEKTSLQEFKSKHGDPVTELSYRIGSNNYKYHTYETGDLPRGLEVLFKDEVLIAVSYIPDGRFAQAPIYRRCTLFPLVENDDPYKCLIEITEQASSRRLDLRDPGTAPDARGLPKDDKVASAVELTAYAFLFSPLLPIVGAIAAANVAEQAAREAGKPDVAVGARKDDLTDFLSKLPDHAISKSGNDMSILVPGGIFRNPTIALGFHEDIVIWVDKRPMWSCPGNGIEGCRLGSRPRVSVDASREAQSKPKGRKEGQAIVYVFSCFRQAREADISLDAKKLLTLKPGNYTWLYVPEGEHVVSATWPALVFSTETQRLKLNASAGESYFIKVYPTNLTTGASSGVIQTRGMALKMSNAEEAEETLHLRTPPRNPQLFPPCQYKEPLPIE
jgi:hypothetical protein